MEKKIIVLITAMVLLGATIVWAVEKIHNPGDIAGCYYYADTEVYIAGYYINSYSIGGKPAILAEDLRWYFSFEVEWNEEKRTTNIIDYVRPEGYTNRGGSEAIFLYFSPDDLAPGRFIDQNIANRPEDYAKKAQGKQGEVAGNVFYTDIKAYLNGAEIPSYNIDDRIAILCEDFAKHGYDVVWDPDKRRTDINERRIGKILESDIGTVYLQEIKSKIGSPGVPNWNITKGTAALIFDGKHSEVFNVLRYSEWHYQMMSPGLYEDYLYVPMAAFFEAVGAKWIYDGKKFEAGNTLFLKPDGKISFDMGDPAGRISMDENIIDDRDDPGFLGDIEEIQFIHLNGFDAALLYDKVVYVRLEQLLNTYWPGKPLQSDIGTVQFTSISNCFGGSRDYRYWNCWPVTASIVVDGKPGPEFTSFRFYKPDYYQSRLPFDHQYVPITAFCDAIGAKWAYNEEDFVLNLTSPAKISEKVALDLKNPDYSGDGLNDLTMISLILISNGELIPHCDDTGEYVYSELHVFFYEGKIYAQFDRLLKFLNK